MRVGGKAVDGSGAVREAGSLLRSMPAGMRVVRLESPRRAPRIGLVIADPDPEPILARAPLELVRELDVGGILNSVLHKHLGA